LKHSGLQKYRWILHVNAGYMTIVFLQQIFTTVFACMFVPTHNLMLGWTLTLSR
jgi:hypothetical protein